LTEVSLAYGPTQVFFTVEPEELVCVKDSETTSWISHLSGDNSVQALRAEEGSTLYIDFRLALDRKSLGRTIEFMRSTITGAGSLNAVVLSPMHGHEYFGGLVESKSLHLQARTYTGGPAVVLTKATCHPFLDLLGSLGPIAFPAGGRNLIEMIDQYLGGNHQDAIATLLSQMKAMDPTVSLMLVDGSDPQGSVLVCTGVDRISQLLQSASSAPTSDIPADVSACVMSLGGGPADYVPSAGIPFVLSALSSWSCEAKGLVAMWNQSQIDLPLFALAGTPRAGLLSRLEERFDWHDIVSYMVLNFKSDERVRVVTSMPPILVKKVLGWRVLGTASDLLKSLRRSVSGRFRLAVVKDACMSFPNTRLDGRETQDQHHNP